jgi:hypothetical protein
MRLTVQKYTEEFIDSWEQFVQNSNNGTIFHTRQFLGYHPPDRFRDHSLIFLDGNRITGLFPAVLLNIDSKNILVSHRGASYGGFVYNENLSISQAFKLLEALDKYAADNQIHRIEMTLPPVIYHQRPSHYIDFALYKSGYSYKKREISSVIPIDFNENSILEQFKPESRTAYRRAKKQGVEIRQSDNFSDFYKILEKNLELRHNVKPTHTLEELIRLKTFFPDRIRQWTAHIRGELAAGVTNFLANDRVLLAFYISHDHRFQKYRPLNLMFYEIIYWCISNQIKFLDFGIFTVNEDPNWGLAKFKESFGARGIFRDTFIKTI